MKKGIKYFTLAFITMILIMTVAFILMIFSSGNDGLRTTLFDALYFESTTLSNGDVEINLGIYDNFAFVLFWGSFIIFIIMLVIESIHTKLLNYKKNLENDRNC